MLALWEYFWNTSDWTAAPPVIVILVRGGRVYRLQKLEKLNKL